MRFFALTTMIMSVAVMTSAGGSDTQILGHACALTSSFVCGKLASHNNGIPFVYWCDSESIITEYEDCDCDTCCVDSSPVTAGAYCRI
ncbi:hypothetical protein K503DRAFT_777119 [Rhizopogon vinicolor AM-OR11-026]|uniref:Uncharacterized protein n=1 Tax=Rhizopogon vinicolor AM-OR11-026 TaxID=1314800 RepID=A0A1B7MHA7_9AGAM|nr:hypothetical protein K503DRAFT_777119 [Rhizopogon vinicolor AM-OR11-026]